MIEQEDLVNKQRAVFWEVIDVFDKQGLLPYVMLMGSWSEFIYLMCVRKTLSRYNMIGIKDVNN